MENEGFACGVQNIPEDSTIGEAVPKSPSSLGCRRVECAPTVGALPIFLWFLRADWIPFVSGISAGGQCYGGMAPVMLTKAASFLPELTTHLNNQFIEFLIIRDLKLPFVAQP